MGLMAATIAASQWLRAAPPPGTGGAAGHDVKQEEQGRGGANGDAVKGEDNMKEEERMGLGSGGGLGFSLGLGATPGLGATADGGGGSWRGDATEGRGSISGFVRAATAAGGQRPDGDGGDPCGDQRDRSEGGGGGRGWQADADAASDGGTSAVGTSGAARRGARCKLCPHDGEPCLAPRSDPGVKGEGGTKGSGLGRGFFKIGALDSAFGVVEEALQVWRMCEAVGM